MTTRYLQFRVHALQCVHITDNRQNFLGISLENDPDSIDISAIITDPTAGMVAQAPPVFLGNHYLDGHSETFAPPKVVAEVPFASDDQYPRQVTLTVNMAEKDDGGGFDHLMEQVAHELTGALSSAVGSELGSGVSSSDYFRTVASTVESIIGDLMKSIGDLLGLGDDPFRAVTLDYTIRSASEAPSGTQTIEFYEPRPEWHGKYVLTYSWHAAETRAIADPGTPGAATAPLTAAGYTPPPYPRPFRSFQFAAPMRKAVALPKPALSTSLLKQWHWFPTPLKLFGAKPKPKR